MEGEGFEPSKAEPSDLQSDPFGRSGIPPRDNLGNADMTLKEWWREKDSNLRRQSRQIYSLIPLAARESLHGITFKIVHLMVEGEGFEPSKAEPSDLQSDPFGRSGTPPQVRAHSTRLSLEVKPRI